MHRFQLSVFLAVAVVFSVIGVNDNIFTSNPAQDAMAAGWFILAIVNITWTLYFTSEEDSLTLHIFNLMGSGGLTPPGRRRRRTQSVHGMGTNGYTAGGYAAPGTMGPSGYDAKPGSFTGGPVIGSAASFKAPSVENRSINQNSINQNAGSIRGPGSAVGGDQVGLASPMMGPGAAGVGAGGGPGALPNITGSPTSGAGGGPTTPVDNAAANTSANSEFTYRAKAQYACEWSASFTW